jgi:hypothetical protein
MTKEVIRVSARYPDIIKVFFIRRKAETAFRRSRCFRCPKGNRPSRACTSPAYAAMRLEAKVQARSVVKRVLA